MKKNSIVAALLTFCSVVNVGAQSRNYGSLSIPADVKWQRIEGAPHNERKRVATTVVLFFGINGEFVRDECSLIREGKTISISNGDPHNQYVGRVRPTLHGVQIEYRLVRRTVERTGEVLPGPKIIQTENMLARPALAIEGRLFLPVRVVNEAEYIEVYNALARQYTDK